MVIHFWGGEQGPDSPSSATNSAELVRERLRASR